MDAFPWREPPLTEDEETDLFMLTLLDDDERPTWSFGGDLQFWATSSFAQSLRSYAREQGLPWYVACMLPIAYSDTPLLHRMLIAPDTFVAFAPDRAREVFDAADEGSFPPFILEVTAAASEGVDRHDKRRIYELLGAREYVIFTPRQGASSTLGGYRRNASDRFVPWLPDSKGRLWSEVLGLYLIARGSLLQAQTPDGQLLLAPEQALTELRRAGQENERLRRELEQYRDKS